MRRSDKVKLCGLLSPPLTLKARLFYSSWEQRGYLHPEIRERLVQVDPSFPQRYHQVKPMVEQQKPKFNLRNIPAELRQEGVLPA